MKSGACLLSTTEPWILHDIAEDFDGEELRLIIVGCIRPEVNAPELWFLINLSSSTSSAINIV